jgi:hypothetical protein
VGLPRPARASHALLTFPPWRRCTTLIILSTASRST